MSPELKIDPASLLPGMTADGYFPDFLVDRVRAVLVEMCHEIAAKMPADLPALYAITCRATDRINDLQDDFYAHESEIETAAREDIADSFFRVAAAYGFPEAEVEELIATRDW